MRVFSELVPFDREQAYLCGALETVTRPKGLSLGDRACLAAGILHGWPVLTCESRWKEIDWKAHGYNLKIHLIREKKSCASLPSFRNPRPEPCPPSLRQPDPPPASPGASSSAPASATATPAPLPPRRAAIPALVRAAGRRPARHHPGPRWRLFRQAHRQPPDPQAAPGGAAPPVRPLRHPSPDGAQPGRVSSRRALPGHRGQDPGNHSRPGAHPAPFHQ